MKRGIPIYSEEILSTMRYHYAQLPERTRRQYAAVEACKLGYGGISYISRALDIDRTTIYKGRKELSGLQGTLASGRQRKEGGGRKKTAAGSELRVMLVNFIDTYKAGSPIDPEIYWVGLTPGQLAVKFQEASGIIVSNGVVKRLLRELGYRYRKPSKTLATGVYAQRDAQFKIIIRMLAILSVSDRMPVVSVDCKKKERLGNLSREGKCLCTGPIKVLDHDYEHLSEGKVIPHGIYDLNTKTGYITVGTSSETAQFVLDNLIWWWTEYGIHQYPDAESILLLCDAGGANSYRHHVFKYRMIEFAKQTGVSLVICHYPPYSSKWNPIEHRLFCHVHQATSGIVFDCYQTVVNAIANTSTSTGITVIVRMNRKFYPTGEKIDKNQVERNRIIALPEIPELNYRIVA